MLDRRSFLFSTATATAALAAAPRMLSQCTIEPTLPDPALYVRDEDAYWRELRKQFLIPADEIYLNNGTVGSSPRAGDPGSRGRLSRHRSRWRRSSAPPAMRSRWCAMPPKPTIS